MEIVKQNSITSLEDKNVLTEDIETKSVKENEHSKEETENSKQEIEDFSPEIENSSPETDNATAEVENSELEIENLEPEIKGVIFWHQEIWNFGPPIFGPDSSSPIGVNIFPNEHAICVGNVFNFYCSVLRRKFQMKYSKRFEYAKSAWNWK